MPVDHLVELVIVYISKQDGEMNCWRRSVILNGISDKKKIGQHLVFLD